MSTEHPEISKGGHKSSDSFEDFLKKLREDAGLQKELHTNLGKSADRIPLEELAEFAAGKGYKFTVEEASGGLSDDQLDAMSGGAYSKVDLEYRPERPR